MLTFNVGQSDRVSLRKGIGTGIISAADLSEMSSADLANEQAKQEMEKAAQEALHQSILKVQTALPRAKITHKGEEIIESNTSEDLQVAREEEEHERVRARLRVRTGSILEGPESSAGMSSSIFGENRLMEVNNDTSTSPEKMFSPDGVLLPSATSPLSPITPFVTSHIVSSPTQETTSPVDQKFPISATDTHSARPSFDLSSLWSSTGKQDSNLPAHTVPETRGGEDEEIAMDLDEEQAEEQDFGMFLDGVEEKGSRPSVALKPTTPPLPPDEGLDLIPVIWSGEVRTF
jgi:hypothetical protein